MSYLRAPTFGASLVPSWVRLARVGLGLIVLAVASESLNLRSMSLGGVSVVWLSNGFLIAVLLCTPRPQWFALLLLGYSVDVGVNVAVSGPLSGNSLLSCAVLSICNMTEVIVAAACMFPAVAHEPNLSSKRQLRSFLLYGVLLAPTITSLMAGSFLHVHDGVPFLQATRFWFAADVIGIAMAVPLYLSYRVGHHPSRRAQQEIVGLFVLLGAVALTVFRLANFPMLWFVLIFLLLLGVRLGFTGAALGLLVVTFIGGFFTVEGYGPLSSAVNQSLSSRILIFQTFVAFSMFSLYVTEAAMAANRSMHHRVEVNEARFRLLAEASRDVITLANVEGYAEYVSPAITEMFGWQPSEILGKSPAPLIKPEDLPVVEGALARLRAGESLRPFEYRFLKKDESYLWVETAARSVGNADNGQQGRLVYVTRDITDRKAKEEELARAYEIAREQAMIDGLTGAANRRKFDLTLESEWRRAHRAEQPLSLLLFDLDCFKLFNDTLGHLAGDDCLRQIVSRVSPVLRRPPDLLARFGGEEFAIVLPNTAGQGAGVLAETIRTAVAECAIPHPHSPYGVVTVSIGCATTVPSLRSTFTDLLAAADAALYVAKQNGRNRIHVS